MNIHPKEKKQKQCLALERELGEISKAESGAAIIKLEKPIRNGWKRFFVLRDDIAHRDDAHVFREILEKINTVVVCRKKNFKRKDGKKLVDIQQNLRFIPKDKWNLPETYKKYFWLCEGCTAPSIIEGLENPDRYHNHNRPAYHFGPTFYFVTKIKPHYITHVREVDGNLASRRAEICQKLKKGGWATLSKLHGYRHRWEYGYDDLIFNIKEDIATTDMRRELNDWNSEL